MAKRKHIRWSKELVVEKIKELHSQGKNLSYKGIHRRPYRSLQYAAERYCGSWRKAIEAAGIDYTKITMRIQHPRNRANIISEIKELARAGEKLNSNQIQKYHHGLYCSARTYFGSWRKAVEAAGFDYDKIQIQPPMNLRRKLDKKGVVDEIIKRQNNGLPLSGELVKKQDSPLYRAARREFVARGWEKALEAAEIDPDTVMINIHWTKRKIRNYIFRLLRANSPLYERFLKMHGFHDLTRAAYRFFGSWKAAIESCGLNYENVKGSCKKWTPQLIIEEIKILKQRGVRLNSKNVHILRRDLAEAGRLYFGSWGQAVEMAGFSYRQESINFTYQAWLKTLTPKQLETIDQQAINISTVRIIERLKTPEEQERFAKITVDHALDAQELGALVVHEKKKKTKSPKPHKPITGEKARLKIYHLTGVIKRLMENMIDKMNPRERVLVKNALGRLRDEIDKWIEEINAASPKK